MSSFEVRSLDDSDNIRFLEDKAFWDSMDRLNLVSCEDAILTLKNNLFNRKTEYNEEHVEDCINYLCKEFSLPQLHEFPFEMPNIVCRHRFLEAKREANEEVAKFKESVRIQVKRLISEIYGKEELDNERIDSAIYTLASDCGLDFTLDQKMNLKREG